LEQLGEIEKRLWTGADTLRANSNFASNEYFLPVMGLIFLRHAYSRFLRVKGELYGGFARRHSHFSYARTNRPRLSKPSSLSTGGA
jgi:type I restriction enzyme M protein